MQYNSRFLIPIIVIVSLIIFYFYRKPTMIHALSNIKTSADAIALFPTSVQQIKTRNTTFLEQAKKDLDTILAIPADQRTFENTAYALDQLVGFSNLSINAAIDSTVDLVNPDDALRTAARDAVLQVQNFMIDHINNNIQLYHAFMEYANGIAKQENLSDEQKYFIQETLDGFERSGLNLPQESLEQVKRLKKEIFEIEQQFDKNIAQDKNKIVVDKTELDGLSEDFIASLAKTDDNKLIITTDYPTYSHVMENCSNGATRKKLWVAYVNRAYPLNKTLLEKLIAKRNELAHLLGFKTYAEYELSDQMVKNPERALDFLNDLNKKARKNATKEMAKFTKNLPASIVLSPGKKFYQWDMDFVKNQYKKNELNLDERKVSEYFPMQHTVDQLLDIYQQFLSLEFKQLPVTGLWDSDVRLIEIYSKPTNQKIGYLFMDLYPRANKFSHACEHTIVPVTFKNGDPNLGVVIVIANFPKPQADKPALLRLKDVNTFFHEFGHAMHALLGRTALSSFAGTSVKRDFVEMPSQMLEEWLWDPAILKMVSSHYQTGQSLPDDLIETILKSRTYDSGFFITRQLFLANLSLHYYNNGPVVDLDAMLKKLFEEYMFGIEYDPEYHFYASFGHLTGYGARYYGYMWSKVFAHDLFNEIKKEGLLNPEVGSRYVDAIIGKGGSKDPNDLLKDFLGREPKQDAFLRDMDLL